MSYIKFNKLRDLNIEGPHAIIGSNTTFESIINQLSTDNIIHIKGENYTSTFSPLFRDSKTNCMIGTLSLEFEKPGKVLKIQDVEIKSGVACHTKTTNNIRHTDSTNNDGTNFSNIKSGEKSGCHSYMPDNYLKIQLNNSTTPDFTLSDNSPFKTIMTGTIKTLKGAEWNSYDIPYDSHIELSFV